MKVLRGQLALVVTGLIGLNGCASIGPPEPPSLELPKAPSDLRAARKGDKVTLRWTIPARTTDRQSLRYLGKTRVCRSINAALTGCEVPVGDSLPLTDFASARKATAQKTVATFTDTLPSTIQQANPTGFATYAVEVLNAADRGAGFSNQVHVPLVPTMAPFSSFAARPTAQGVLISWQCPPASGGGRADTRYQFRIYRHSESIQRETRIAEVDVTECVSGPGGLVELSSQPSGAGANEQIATSFLDQSVEWESTYFYRGAVVSVMEATGKAAIDVEGDDTPEIKVFAHDVFPPGVPSGLQAVFSGPGQEVFIDLIWAPVSDADLDGYNIYRHEDGSAPVKVNLELVKMPAFRDLAVVAGKTYFYSVSAVDQRGNESARSEEASEAVP
jgi:hypothetical protein